MNECNTLLNRESGAGEQSLAPHLWEATDPRFWQWKKPARDADTIKTEANLDLPSMVLQACGLDLTNPVVVVVLHSVSREGASFQANSIAMRMGCGPLAVAASPAPCRLYKMLMDAGRLSELKGRKKTMFTHYVNRMNFYMPDMDMSNLWLDSTKLDTDAYEEDEMYKIDQDEATYEANLTTWAGGEFFGNAFDDARGKYDMHNDAPPSPPTTKNPYAYNIYKKRTQGFFLWLPPGFVAELRAVDRFYTEIHTWCFIAFMIKLAEAHNMQGFIALVKNSKDHLNALNAHEYMLKKRKRHADSNAS